MKRILTLITISLAVACQQNTEGLEAKRQALNEKQKQLSTLKAEIKDLKAEIAELDTAVSTKVLTPVKIQTVQPEKFEHFTQLTGSVTSRENVLISAETMGRITSIPVREGQQVSAGKALVMLENEGLTSQLNEMKAAFELAEITYQKRKKLWDQNIGSEIEFLQAKNNYERTKSQLAQIQSQYEKSFIQSPISGFIDEIRVNVGELVSSGTPVARVVDLDRVEIEAELSEEYLRDVDRGDTVEVHIPALGMTQRVPVSFVGQVINPENRSFKIKVNLKNEDKRIKPNVLANLKIRDYVDEEALVIPSIAIRKDLKGNYIYVAKEENGSVIAAKKYIETGKSFDDRTEIKGGIEKGDKVIVSGFNRIVEGDALKVN